MKKRFMLLAVITTAFLSCQKEAVRQPTQPTGPTVPVDKTIAIVKDNSFTDRTVSAKGQMDTIGRFDLTVGNLAPYLDVTQVYWSLATTANTSTNPTARIRNVEFCIKLKSKDSTLVSWRPANIGTNDTYGYDFTKVIGGGLPFSIATSKIYTVLVRGTVDPDLRATVQIKNVYATCTWRVGTAQQYSNTDPADGHMTTYSVGTIVTAKSLTTPSGIVVGSNPITMKFTAKSLYQQSFLRSITVAVSNASYGKTASLYYDSTVLLGTANFNGAFATITINNFVMPKDMPTELSVRITPNTTLGNGENLKTALVRTEYTTSGGDVRMNDTALLGEDMYFYTAVLQMKKTKLTTVPLMNGVPNEVLQYDVTAIGGDMSIKQLMHDIIIDDSKSTGKPWIGGFQLFVDGTNASASLTFTMNTNNQLISTFKNELVIAKGATMTISLRAKIDSFASGDGLKVALVRDQASAPAGVQYLCTGPSSTTVAGLSNASGRQANAKFYGMLISTRTDPNHSPSLAFSSGDWRNGSSTIFVQNDPPVQIWTF